MSEQITLLDVCKLPDVQIHSKTALFKYLVGRQTTEMQKLRQNIVKLSYTNKIIGVRGNQVGITSKRLPLKFKQPKVLQPKANDEIDYYYENAGFIPHKNFYVAPLPTVRKNTEQKKQTTGKNGIKINAASLQNLNQYQETQYLKTNSWKARSQSMARLRIFQRRPIKADYEIKMKNQNQIQSKRGRVKSYSNLLKQVNTNNSKNTIIHPISHQQNTLFKRYQKIVQKDQPSNIIYRKQNEEQDIMLIDE